MRGLSAQWQRVNTRLEAYVKVPGDDSDTVLQKKIWWLLNLCSVPVLAVSVAFMGSALGEAVLFFNILFLLSMVVPLVVFHFHRRNIIAYALFSQLALVILTSIKVYLMGGMVNVGTPVYVGLIGPVYALILPNKKRAINIFLLYTLAMITATLANPLGSEPYVFYRYFLGFLISNSAIFFTLYYFTSQWEKAKEAERSKFKELDELKTKFYTHIAHEFRTPLSVITGMTDQIKANPSKWLDKGHEMIKRNSDNLISLTNQLLDLSKLEDRSMPLNPIHDDMVLYTRYLVESFHSMAEINGVKLTFRSDIEELYMDMDPDKVRDVLSNLISNALKFTPEGGSVDVILHLVDKGKKPYVKLQIKDTGVGIPLEEQAYVFNRYFQAKNQIDNRGTGTGLGLALTKELVNLMGGNISVKSKAGKGSVFEITLPISHEAEPISLPDIHTLEKENPVSKKDKPSTYPVREQLPSSLKLLLVEDNTDVIRYLKSLLDEDYTVETAVTGLDGYDVAVKTIPDLIISDVMMPEMDGFTLCKKLKADLRTSHIPIVLLTARSDFDSRIEGLSTGADAYLSKPFNKRELFVRINALINSRKTLQARYAKLQDQYILSSYASNEKFQREDTFIKKVRQILETHLSNEEFGIAQLCDALAMSRSQLYRKFAALTDTSVNQFIIALRLEKAKVLLTTSALNISEVAYDTGFKNPAYFSRVFSERYGYPPSQAKK